jgi:hypothetical protein
MHTTHPGVFSGISGPGHRVVGDGYGGYRTGREGTMYRGLEPAKPGWLDFGNRALGTAVRDGIIPPLRPIWELHLRDTIINRGGDGCFYMTGSSSDNIWDVTSGIELWRSKDVRNWDYLGLVWSFAKDATWEKGARYVWAPEIHYVRGNYYIAYCVSGGRGGGTGILKSKSGKAEGPYVNALASGTRIGGGIDATLFEDEDGSVYFTSGGGGSIQKMLPDLSGGDGPAQSIRFDKPGDGSWTRGSIAQEGASLFKHRGIYYLGGAAFYRGRYSSVVARSTNIYGPYMHWQEAVPCGGGGNYFQGPDRCWYCTYFGNDDQSPWREKPGIVRIDFEPDGSIKIADEQPAYVLRQGAATHWRTTAKPATTALIDYFRPMPIRGALSKEAWGAAAVGARDPQNGLEDPTVKKWYYWDGQIIKGPEGKYHMFASRWDQAKGHRGWGSSCAVHAVSDNVMGPYVDKGLCWPDDQGGKGHNVTALVLPDGRYAVVVSETRPGDVFVSKSLDGPWQHLGKIQVAANEFSRLSRMSNVSIMVRPDGDFMIVPRSGAILISKNGILGPYTVQGPSVYPTAAGLPLKNLEDPVIWYSCGLYHIVVNAWSTRKAYHLTSPDGIKHWTFRGLAYDPTTNFVRYTDGTVNHWHKMERPGVLLQNGHVTHFTFAVLDVPKEEQHGNDAHGSKIIVVPFDGTALDRDLQTHSPAPVE